MIRKIAKYSKILLSVVLILSMFAPSYASLSAADGSAFVTKAEFDSAMVDFNSRLTTFEAGINSKIDSQVTSYLDRNGIWNGQRQVIKNSNITSTFVKSSSQYIGAMEQMKASSGGPWSYDVANNRVYRLSNMTPTDICICEKTTKAGLCYLQYSQSAIENGWMHVSWDGQSCNSDWFYFSYSYIMDVYDGLPTTPGSSATKGSELLNSIVEAGSTTIPARCYIRGKKNQHILFFVKKNISLWAHTTNTNTGYAGVTCPGNWNGGPTWTIENLYIY